MNEVFSMGSAWNRNRNTKFSRRFAVSILRSKESVDGNLGSEINVRVVNLYLRLLGSVVMQVLPILPYALAFSLGYDFIVVEEVIPESNLEDIQIWHYGFNIRIYSDDGIRCFIRINPVLFTILAKI